MATRKRMLAPNIWQDSGFGLLSQVGKLLWIGCITQADDEGRLTGNPVVLKGILFPFGDPDLNDVFDGVEELRQTMKNFILYEVGGECFIQLKNWKIHQILRADRKADSTFPAPPREALVDKRLSGGCQVGTQVSKEVSKQGSNDAAIKILNHWRTELESKGILTKKKLI